MPPTATMNVPLTSTTSEGDRTPSVKAAGNGITPITGAASARDGIHPPLLHFPVSENPYEGQNAQCRLPSQPLRQTAPDSVRGSEWPSVARYGIQPSLYLSGRQVVLFRIKHVSNARRPRYEGRIVAFFVLG